MKQAERAKYLFEKLGYEGAIRQCADEWANCNTDEEREYWNMVMGEINKILKNVINTLIAPSEKARKVLKELKIS